MTDDAPAPAKTEAETYAENLARCEARRAEGLAPEQAYTLMQGEGLGKLLAGKLLRQVYGLTFEEMSAVVGIGTPFRTTGDTVRYLREEMGYCPCVGEQPIFFLRDVLQLLHARIKAAGQETPDEFRARTDEFRERAGLAGADADGGGPWFILFLQHRNLLFHNRNVGDCFLTRKGEYLLQALDVLIASEALPALFQNAVPEDG